MIYEKFHRVVVNCLHRYRIDLALDLHIHSVLLPGLCDMNVPWEILNCLEK